MLGFGLGAVEALLTFVRRWIQSSAVLGMETAVRSDLYRHLQRLGVSFRDRWQSGQLLSRAGADLGVVRRFVGFGLIFLVVNLLTCLTVLALLLRLSVPLGLVVLGSMLPIAWISRRWTRRYFQISRRAQDQQGDLATVIEESAVGIRIVKAFGRRELVDERFGAAAQRLAGSWMDAVRLRARFWTLLDVIPSLALAVVLCLGALAVARGLLSLGGLIAFLSLQLQRSRSPPGRSARTSSSPHCPTATTPRCASAAGACPPAGASWFRSPARSSPTRPCSSSTRPPRPSTSPASARCSAPCGPSSPTHRRHRPACPPWRSPTACWCSTRGRIVEDGPPEELIRDTGRYADLRQAWIDSLV